MSKCQHTLYKEEILIWRSISNVTIHYKIIFWELTTNPLNFLLLVKQQGRFHKKMFSLWLCFLSWGIEGTLKYIFFFVLYNDNTKLYLIFIATKEKGSFHIVPL